MSKRNGRRRKSRSARCPCLDCGWKTLSPVPGELSEWYMVTDQVWADAGAGEEDYLCLGCLEQRVGRQLNRDDFDDVLLNDLSVYRPDKAWWWRTDRLLDRLSSSGAPEK